MTSIRTYDPATAGGAVPELPPLSIGVLAVATAELLQQAADLQQPCYISIFDGQAIDCQFPPEQASICAITRWALRFGGVVVSEPLTTGDGPRTYCKTEFDYYGIKISAYTLIPAEPATT